MKVAIVQTRSSDDPWENLAVVQSFIEEAYQNRCSLICFPENILFRGPRDKLDPKFFLKMEERGRLIVDSEFSRALQEVIEQSQIAISLGSVVEAAEDPSRPYNTQLFVTKDKEIVRYRKIHLFRFAGSQAIYREDRDRSAGREVACVSMENFRIGLSICYDLRFPEMFRHLSTDFGANVFLVPSAFTRETGMVHWYTLLRARAIENLSYVLAPAQWGSHWNEQGRELFCYGHALAYGPWGELLSEAAETSDELLVVDLDLGQVERARERLPIFNSTHFRMIPQK